MAKVIIDGRTATIHCPGCDETHQLDIHRWTFNGDCENPTFSPSLLVRSGHFASRFTGDCWCNYEERYGEKPGFACYQCHSFITDGKIQFLNDSTHKLAGQTVELPEVK